MKFLRRVFFRRFRSLGALSDVAMVAAAATRVARKPGSGSGRSAPSPGEMMLVAGAALRLFRRIRKVRRNRRSAKLDIAELSD